jgi:hypothetical protein
MKIHPISIGLSLESPTFVSEIRKFVYNNLDEIDKRVCEIFEISDYFYLRPSIDLSDRIDWNSNMCYHHLKIRNKELYQKLKRNPILELDSVKFSISRVRGFDVDTYRLGLEVQDSNLYPILKEYNQALGDNPPLEYNPTIGITYLKSYLNEGDLRVILSEIDKSQLTEFVVRSFVIEDAGYKSFIPINKK